MFGTLRTDTRHLHAACVGTEWPHIRAAIRGRADELQSGRPEGRIAILEDIFSRSGPPEMYR
jgi:hypothetical protein